MSLSDNEDLNRSTRHLQVRTLRFGELDQKIINAWISLEERALESNAYLSPRFVIPALSHLADPSELEKTIFVFIEKPGGKATGLLGAGVFVHSARSNRFPLPHLRAYRSIYSFLSGLLVDKDAAENVIRAFFRFFCSRDASWHGVAFSPRYAEGPLAELMTACANEFKLPCYKHLQSRRAIFRPSEGGDAYIQTHFSKKRKKDQRRLWRRLEEQGKVRWQALFGADADEESVERFLHIEHMGWKRDEGTSLRSNTSHEAFFKEITRDFNQKGDLFLTELSLDGNVISSTTNFISGGVGFAFKIGYHPHYTKTAPGMLNELEFIRQAPDLCRSLSYIDSGAEEGSYIDRLWTGRREMDFVIFATSSIGKAVLCGIKGLRKIKHRFRSVRRGESS